MKKSNLLKRILIFALCVSPVLAEEISPPIVHNNERLFLRVTAPKTTVYIGERLLVTISLYITGLNIDKVFSPALAQDDFDYGTVAHRASTTAVINGRQYQVIRFDTTATPLKEGISNLGPVTVGCRLSQNQDDDFESTPELYRLARGTLETTAPKVPLRVISLPTAHRPAGFSGGIGRFQIFPELRTAHPQAGEALTIRLTVSGSGNFENIGLPVLADTANLEVFPIQRTAKTDRQIIYEQTVIPRGSGLTQIGPYQLSYFNPDTRRYHTATASLPVQIAAKSGSMQSVTTEESKIAGIKRSAAGLSARKRLLLLQPWFWWLQLLPVLALILTIIIHHYRRRRQTDVKVQQAKGEKNAMERLTAAKALIGPSGTDRLLSELYTILLDYANLKFNPKQSKPLMLEELNAVFDDESREAVQSFLTRYEQIRFTGTDLKPSQSEDLWCSVYKIMLMLQKMPAAANGQQTEGGQSHD